jgi:protein-S-isoprenylcysteine O-methyltransferase Ste14
MVLVGVLLAKAVREEGYLRTRFPEYVAHQAHTARFIPRLF